jgi:hypothetical protein
VTVIPTCVTVTGAAAVGGYLPNMQETSSRQPDPGQPRRVGIRIGPLGVTGARWTWILVVIAATALDLVARFGESFDFRRVMHVEAILFPVTSVVLSLLFRYEPVTRSPPRAVRTSLIWLFSLGGLRALLWTIGLPLMASNLSTAIVALVGVSVLLRRRQRDRR